MNARREGLIWEVLGFAVVIVAAWRVFAATQQFTDTLNQKFAGNMDLVWYFGVGVFAGFCLLAGAAAMISGHAMRVLTGAKAPWFDVEGLWLLLLSWWTIRDHAEDGCRIHVPPNPPT